MTRHVAIFAVSVLALLAAGCGGPAPAAVPTVADGVEDLAAQVKALQESVPDQAHIMADVGDHFTNLWFAGEAENWPLADFYLGETRSHLRWAVRVKPIRKDNAGRDVNLPAILDAFDGTQLAQLKNGIDHKDKAAFEALYRESLTMCYACHKASDKPYLRPQIPTAPASPIINFNPKADWPL